MIGAYTVTGGLYTTAGGIYTVGTCVLGGGVYTYVGDGDGVAVGVGVALGVGVGVGSLACAGYDTTTILRAVAAAITVFFIIYLSICLACPKRESNPHSLSGT